MNKYGNTLTNRLIKKIVFSTIIYTFIFIFIWVVAKTYCESKIWQPYDQVYQFLKIIKENVIIEIIIYLIGFAIISFYHLRKTLSYIDAIVNASILLVDDNEEYIVLPPELKEIEVRINKVKKRALDSEKKKNDLIAYLAHDIKTPLTSMIGYLTLLNEIPDTTEEDRKKYLKIAIDKSYHLEDLINELFDITKFNLHEVKLNKKTFNLSLLIMQIADDFYPIAKGMHKQVRLDLPEEIILVADADKLARVMDNLIKNALNYSDEDSDIFIKAYKKKNTANIIITNKGKNLNAEEMSKIFDKFYRGDKSRSSILGGSGLGLAISKEIITLHDGKITVSSKNNETSFIIELPLN